MRSLFEIEALMRKEVDRHRGHMNNLLRDLNKAHTELRNREQIARDMVSRLQYPDTTGQ